MNKMVRPVGDGSSLVFKLTHNFGTPDVVVAIRDSNLPGEQIGTDVTILSKDEVQISFAVAPGNDAYTVTIIG